MSASVTFHSQTNYSLRIQDFPEAPLFPDTVCNRIFSFLSPNDLVVVSKVCQQWCRVFQSTNLVPKSFELFCKHFPLHVDLAEDDYLEALKEASHVNNQLMLIEIIEAGRHLAQAISTQKLRTKILYQKMYELAEKHSLFSMSLTLIQDLRNQGDHSLSLSQPEWVALDFYIHAKERIESLPFKAVALYVSVLQKLSEYFLHVKKDFSSAGKWIHIALSQPYLGPSLKKQLTENAFEIIRTFHAQHLRESKKKNLKGALHCAKQRGEPLTPILQQVIDSGDALYENCCFKEAASIYAIGCEVEIAPETAALVESIRNKRRKASECVGNPSIVAKWKKNPSEQLQEIRQKVMQLTGENLGFQMQQEMTAQITQLIETMVNNCEKLIGPKPCDYVILGLGSLSHSGMSLYSDLEFAILLPIGVSQSYFKVLTELLELKVIEFGESTPDKHNPYYQKGFAFDDGGNTPLGKKELMGTCSELIQSITLQDGGDLILVNCLIEASFLYGSSEIFLEYKRQVNARLDANDQAFRSQYSQRILEEAQALAIEAMEDPPQLWNEGKFNVKSSLYRMCSFFVMALSHYYQANASDLPSRIDRLLEKKKLHPEIGKKLKEVLNFAALLRNHAQWHYKQEKETVYQGDYSDKQHFRIECLEMRVQLEELFYTVIIPTFHLLKDFTLSEKGVFNVESYVQGHLALAEVVLKQNEYHRARSLCHQVIAFDSENSIAKTLLGNIAYAEGQWDESQKFLSTNIRLDNTQRAWKMLIAQWEEATVIPPTLTCSASYQEIISNEIHPIFIQAFVLFASLLNTLSPQEAQIKFHKVYEELYKIFPRRQGCQALVKALQDLVSPLLWCRDGFLFAFYQDKHLWHEVLDSIIISYSPYVLEGVRSGNVCLSPEVINEILEEGQIVRKYEHGRRRVAQVEKAHFK